MLYMIHIVAYLEPPPPPPPCIFIYIQTAGLSAIMAGNL